jgi:hypothetical protein
MTKLQIPKKDSACRIPLWDLVIGIWDLIGIWILGHWGLVVSLGHWSFDHPARSTAATSTPFNSTFI